VSPSQPGTHSQEKELTPSVQVPPFSQGLGEQFSESTGIKKVTIDRFLM
jgi:hypothetical protein